MCRGHISPERAVQLYTNHHWHVPGEMLAEAAHWLKFAVSIYGLEPHSHQENRWANAVRTWVRQWRESRSKGKSGLVSKRSVFETPRKGFVLWPGPFCSLLTVPRFILLSGGVEQISTRLCQEGLSDTSCVQAWSMSGYNYTGDESGRHAMKKRDPSWSLTSMHQDSSRAALLWRPGASVYSICFTASASGSLVGQSGCRQPEMRRKLFTQRLAQQELSLLCRQKSGSLYEKLNYEAIKQQAAVQDSELIYVSFANRALAHLPYMVTLDPSSRWGSCVVTLKGGKQAGSAAWSAWVLKCLPLLTPWIVCSTWSRWT